MCPLPACRPCPSASSEAAACGGCQDGGVSGWALGYLASLRRPRALFVAHPEHTRSTLAMTRGTLSMHTR
eukprot:1181611-Prymnesium_polylepis.1